MDKKAGISVVIPLHNESDSVFELIKSLNKAFAGREIPWEVVLIDDGSTDSTASELRECAGHLENFKIIRFRKNLGKSAAYSVGFSNARNGIIATMDGDLQDDPGDILRMLDCSDENSDFISGRKAGKNSFFKSMFSRLFNFSISLASGLKLHDINCPLRLFKRECVKNIFLKGELFRFLPLLVRQKGFRVVEVPVSNMPRKYGSSKFGMRRYFQGFLDLFYVLFIKRYLDRPLHFFGAAGILLFFSGFCIDAFLTIRGVFFTGRIGHFALLLFGAMLMIIGVQTFLFGFLGVIISEKEHADYTEYIM